jgi:hypothetical protein
VASIKNFTILRFILRSLTPSLISFYLCVLLSAFLLAAHLLLLSAAQGTSLPGLLNGRWATFYTNTVVQPIETLINNSSINDIMTVVLWGVFGLVVYSILESITVLVREGRQAEQDMQWGQRILHHPMRRAYIITMLWRASVLLLGFTAVTMISPVPLSLLEADARLVAGSYDLSGGLQQLGLALISWTLIMHMLVIFLRLLLLKPRLFGDERVIAN